jgi:GNAT superfamily N-acetyltransferase
MPQLRAITESCGADSLLIRRLAELFREARRAHLQFSIDLHSEEEDRRFLSEVMLPENQVWVAEMGGGVVGYIAFADGWVNHLYIAPQFQRRGIGGKLLEIAKEAHARLELWVFQANAPAISFYQRQGFRPVEMTDGAGNEAKMPDVRMEWRGVNTGATNRRPSRRWG